MTGRAPPPPGPAPGPPPGPPPPPPPGIASRAANSGPSKGSTSSAPSKIGAHDGSEPQRAATATSSNGSGSFHGAAPSNNGSQHTQASNDTASSTPAVDDKRAFALERTLLLQQLEIDRILSAFRLNPYDVLEVPLEADDKEINKIYRKKSLLIHPDKVKHERAVEAFDLLKKASSHLLDEDKRKALDETVLDARLMVLKELNLPFSTDHDDPQLLNLTPSWDERVRGATKELMVDDELRRRKAIRIQHQAEGEAQRKKEQAVEERKRKADHDTAWEQTRDHRVADWRAFQKGGKKKKKADANVLG